MDANDWDEAQRRRGQFTRWLLRAWEWALDKGLPVADILAELISHASEPDYPLWDLAVKRGVIDDSKMADMLRHACGRPVIGPYATDWERQINYAPVIYVDEDVWRMIHGQLGWVNRDHDDNIPHCFWLWSNAANAVRFVMRKKEKSNAAI